MNASFLRKYSVGSSIAPRPQPAVWRSMCVDLKLVVRCQDDVGQDLCCLCARPCELVSVRISLSDREGSRGYVCQECLEAGPQKAAARVRRRAAQTRFLMRQGRKLFPPRLRHWVPDIICDYADQLDTLAE